jgi:hypothetical protein
MIHIQAKMNAVQQGRMIVINARVNDSDQYFVSAVVLNKISLDGFRIHYRFDMRGQVYLIVTWEYFHASCEQECRKGQNGKFAIHFVESASNP